MAVTETRDFHLGDILTVTTGGFLVSPRMMEGVYDILDWMTGDNLFTHQLPRALRECQPALLAQHPDLAGIVVPTVRGTNEERRAAIFAWLYEMVVQYGEMRPVARLAADEHAVIDPITELRQMMPGKEILLVGTSSEAKP